MVPTIRHEQISTNARTYKTALWKADGRNKDGQIVNSERGTETREKYIQNKQGPVIQNQSIQRVGKKKSCKFKYGYGKMWLYTWMLLNMGPKKLWLSTRRYYFLVGSHTFSKSRQWLRTEAIWGALKPRNMFGNSWRNSSRPGKWAHRRKQRGHDYWYRHNKKISSRDWSCLYYE